MRIGVYCNSQNVTQVVQLFKTLFPEHSVLNVNNFCDGSFMTTNHKGEIIVLDKNNLPNNNTVYDIYTLEEFNTKYYHKKGDIVRWRDYDTKYKVIGVSGKYQRINYDLIDEEGYYQCVYWEQLTPYEDKNDIMSDKNLITSWFREIKYLASQKKFGDTIYDDNADKLTFDSITDIAKRALKYLSENVSDTIK